MKKYAKAIHVRKRQEKEKKMCINTFSKFTPCQLDIHNVYV